MTTAIITKAQKQFSDDLQKFLTLWNFLSHDEHRAENVLTTETNRLAEEIRAKTCPSWCSKEIHEEDVADFWDSFRKGGSEIHSKAFGDGVAMGDPDGLSGVELFFAIDAFGNVVDEPLNRPTIAAHARAFAAANLEAADFWKAQVVAP